MNVHASTFSDTFVEGQAKVKVAANKTFQLGELRVKGTNVVLQITTAGTFSTDYLGIEADQDNAQRFLKLVGGTLGIGPTAPQITVQSDPAGNGQAKLWVASTTLDFDDVAAATFSLLGGDDPGEEAELDLDVDLTIPVATSIVGCRGRVAIDIAANKTFSIPRLIIGEAGVGAIVKFTAGSGAAIEVDIAN